MAKPVPSSSPPEKNRWKSNRPKVMSPVLFRPMLKWVIVRRHRQALTISCGHRLYEGRIGQYLQSLQGKFHSVFQSERKGTGHAVRMADQFLRQYPGWGCPDLKRDAPFIDPSTIAAAHEAHISEGNAVTVISAELDNPFGYGRIVRDSESGMLKAIIEQKDANHRVQAIKEVNSGAYWFDVDALLSVLYDISNKNAQGNIICRTLSS